MDPFPFDPSLLQQRSLMFQQAAESSAPVTYPCLADVAYIQQQFAAGAPPSLVTPATVIPLYPGYTQVPPGPGYSVNPFDSKYTQLLAVIEEMSKDLRPTYSGSKTSTERFKRGIAQARILLRACSEEIEGNRK